MKRRIEQLRKLIEEEEYLIGQCPMLARDSKPLIARWQKELDELMNSTPLLNWRSTHVH